MVRYWLACIGALLLYACRVAVVPAVSVARQAVSLTAAFTPDRLGARTTMEFGVRVTAPNGAIPSPAIRMQLAYPANLGIANSGLGLGVCEASLLMSDGPAACPSNSRIGLGNATVEVPFSPTVVRERARITVFAAPVQDGALGMLLVATASSPIIAELLLPARTIAAAAPFGGSLDTAFPVVPTVPEGSHVAVVQFHVTLGPRHITYVEHIHGRTVRYRPQGLRLPVRCPKGGFPFKVEMTFEDGTQARATTVAKCPSRHRG